MSRSIETASSSSSMTANQRSAPPGTEWIDARALRELEPGLRGFSGAVLHPRDGSVDNVVLFDGNEAARGVAALDHLVRASVRSVQRDRSPALASILDDRRGRGGRIARHRHGRVGRAARRPSPPAPGQARSRAAAHARGSTHSPRDLRRRRVRRAQAWASRSRAVRAHAHRRDDGGSRVRERDHSRGARGAQRGRAANPPRLHLASGSCHTGLGSGR